VADLCGVGTEGYSDADAYSKVHSDADAHSDTDTHSDADAHADADAHSDPPAHANAGSNEERNGHRHADDESDAAHPFSDTHRDRRADRFAHCDADQ
jgi:hypothetical protein